MNKQQGVSLMELLVVMLIIGILAAMAFPAYSNHVKKTRRNIATGCLQQNVQYMERWYTSNMTYEGAAASACPAEIADFYTVTVDVTGPREFTATAEPIGAQVDDKCGTMTIDEKGTRDSEGTEEQGCW